MVQDIGVWKQESRLSDFWCFCMDRLAEVTICGIATAVGDGGIGVVRISGPDAMAIADQVVRLRSNKSLTTVRSHTVHLADIRFRRGEGRGEMPGLESGLSEGEVIDQGLVVVMEGPRSFTGEHVVEIQCHGGQTVLGLVCEACVASGARLAEPGEFTRRAFLNGRLDLTQAEAVLDTIQAKSEAGLRMAQRQLRGELGGQVSALRGRLVSLLSGLEAEIDFSEEEETFVDPGYLSESLAETVEAIERMLGTAKMGIRIRDGARVVMTGRPNVGKSSLLNYLLGQDRAIVTDVPGTTRDVIEESVSWGGLRVALVDTAGVRETDDIIEREGIKRTKAAVEEADVVVEVVDASQGGDGGGGSPWVINSRNPDVIVINKIDLVDESYAARLSSAMGAGDQTSVIAASARTGAGLDMLREAIASRLSGKSFEPDGGAVVTKIRHQDALERARVSLKRAMDAFRSGVGPEFVVVDVRESADALGEVTGEITSDEILNHIFSQFCIGK